MEVVSRKTKTINENLLSLTEIRSTPFVVLIHLCWFYKLCTYGFSSFMILLFILRSRFFFLHQLSAGRAVSCIVKSPNDLVCSSEIKVANQNVITVLRNITGTIVMFT